MNQLVRNTSISTPLRPKVAPLHSFSRENSEKLRDNSVFRAKYQQIRATAKNFAPNLNKSAPQQKFSRRTRQIPRYSSFFRAAHPNPISKPLSSLQLSLLKTLSPSLIVSTTCISLISIVSTSKGFRSNTTKSASFPSAILPFSSSSK